MKRIVTTLALGIAVLSQPAVAHAQARPVFLGTNPAAQKQSAQPQPTVVELQQRIDELTINLNLVAIQLREANAKLQADDETMDNKSTAIGLINKLVAADPGSHWDAVAGRVISRGRHWNIQKNVVEDDPPTISCAAAPAAVRPGDLVKVTATAASPQGRPLSYSYSASAGSISGTAPSATLMAVGASPGAITVTCNAADDQGNHASSTTTVTVTAPPPAPTT